MSYDSQGNLLTRTLPTTPSSQESLTYNALNEPLSYTDPRGNTTGFGYDDAGNLTSLTAPDQSQSQYGYDPQTGLLSSITNALGKTTQLGYDQYGNLTSLASPEGNQTAMTYDQSGRMTSRTDPRGSEPGANPDAYTWHYSYDTAGNLLSVTDPLGHVTSYTYDLVGNLLTKTDANNHSWTYTYDAANHLKTVMQPGGGVTTYNYDYVGNLTSRVDPKNHTTSYAYDKDDRLTSVTSALNKIWRYAYDDAGNVTLTTLPSGATISYGYDALGRLTSIDYSDSTPDVSFGYDANGNRTQMTDGAGNVSYSYDTLNRLTGVTRGVDSFAYGYDAAGHLTQRTDPDGQTATYGYTDDGELASVDGGLLFGQASYSYDPAGNLIETLLPNGTGVTRAYDEAGELQSLTNWGPGGPISTYAYTRDAVGNPTEISGSDGVETLSYDPLDRLTGVCYQASCPGGSDPFIRWTYDQVGNRLTEARPSGTTSYSYNAGDQLTSAGATSFSYDLNGNETQAGSRAFAYNAVGRMISTTASGQTTTYAYDGEGSLLTVSGPSGTSSLLWDVNLPLPQIALERDGAGQTLRSYLYGNERISMSAGGARSYYLSDGSGNVTGLTSASGDPQWSYSYEPFGTLRSQTKLDPAAPDNPMLFAGEQQLSSGLYNLRARDYDPSMGRFTSLDPLGYRDTPQGSIYGYAGNNPVVFADPSGMGKAHDDCTGIRGFLGCDLTSDPRPIVTTGLELWHKGQKPLLVLGAAWACAKAVGIYANASANNPLLRENPEAWAAGAALVCGLAAGTSLEAKEYFGEMPEPDTNAVGSPQPSRAR
jgi:RHS repeat-associated protein